MVVRRSREEWKIYGNVFDQHTGEVLRKLQGQGLFDELAGAIALGKEANVFTATPGRGSDREELVVVKIYRLENCNFKKMYEYLKHDPRYMHTKPDKRTTVFAWCQREYRNLLLAREAISCPTPLSFRSNVVVMTLIGNDGVAARMLKDQAPEEPTAFLALILKDIAALWKKGLVHGDLSGFNILNHGERPVLIDFSQGTPTSSPNAQELLRRDLTNIAAVFRKLDVKLDVEKEMQLILG